MADKQFTAWSSYGAGFLRELAVDVHVAEPVGGPGVAQVNPRACRGIWDTGATGVVITPAVVNDLGLVATGKSFSHTGNGTVTCDTYIVSLRLPNGILLDTEAICLDVPSCEVLVGMSVIHRGDFSVTNVDGKTTVSFRVPSCHTIDYVKEAKNIRTVAEAKQRHSYAPKPRRGKKH